ncbi:zinc finger protein with KRAB and SCAN domains 8-like [Sabethes cyaneus]|uniref:zinc finger protein with KRAB and SCAN domains 8-like n=1 Tax=Sabethes cyaneus TaxID=53552 RepID=UPI00237EE326|nr:zinc finger protein with KRAB and SCAN domains 8-like [Sabethes cyaneus]
MDSDFVSIPGDPTNTQFSTATNSADPVGPQTASSENSIGIDHTSSNNTGNSGPRIVYLDRVCRTCLVEKDKDQLKDLFECELAVTVMGCINIPIEESDGLPSHICLDCLHEVERICNFRQQCERSDIAIRNLIDKSVVIKQDSQTKYEILNVVLTDGNGHMETSAVVVPIEELRFQLMKGGRSITAASAGLPETISIPLTMEEPQQSIEQNIQTGLEASFSVAENPLEQDLVCSGSKTFEVDPSELLNEPVPKFSPKSSQQEESVVLENLRKELSEFIGSVPKDQDLDDNEDDEMIHVDYLKDALTEEYIQNMEKQLAPSVPRSDDHEQNRLEQENLDMINDEDHDKNHKLEPAAKTNLNNKETAGLHCKVCDQKFENNLEHKKHLKTHSQKQFNCTQCPRAFADQSKLESHASRHSGEKTHACNKCEARFHEKSMLRVHMRRHSTERRYNCETCGKRFMTKSLLNTHNKIHLGEKSHVCTECGKGFTLSWQLKAHTRIHTNEKPFECPYCQKRFNQNGNLMIHIRLHTGERPFRCDLCEKAYPSQGELSGHMRQHTGEKKVKNMVCTVCGKAFAGKGDLKIHMRTHTKEKPYSCQQCGKSFMLHVHLTVHMRSHTGEKPFACTMCEKAFATNFQLKNHTYVHTGEKNYVCDVCNRRFTSSANRNTHRKTHDRKISRQKYMFVG